MEQQTVNSSSENEQLGAFPLSSYSSVAAFQSSGLVATNNESMDDREVELIGISKNPEVLHDARATSPTTTESILYQEDRLGLLRRSEDDERCMDIEDGRTGNKKIKSNLLLHLGSKDDEPDWLSSPTPSSLSQSHQNLEPFQEDSLKSNTSLLEVASTSGMLLNTESTSTSASTDAAVSLFNDTPTSITTNTSISGSSGLHNSSTDEIPHSLHTLERSNSQPRRSRSTRYHRLLHRNLSSTAGSDSHSISSVEDEFSMLQDFRSETESIGSNTSSSSGGGSHQLMRMRRLRNRHRPTSVPETIQEQQQQARTRLRQSLDAGMAAVRRWIRSRVSTPRRTVLDEYSRDDLYPLRPAAHPLRERALSEPEGRVVRDFYFERATSENPVPSPHRWQYTNSASGGAVDPTSNPLRAAAISSSIFHAEDPPAEQEEVQAEDDSQARQRWYLLNRRFQFTITIVALLFSLLLFAILVCWVVLTSGYVVSIEKPCDVPLKTYFWMATVQLILDVFRTDIMRLLCRWEQNSSNGVPLRVISYNVAYFVYALLVLRVGLGSVFFTKDNTCHETAPDLFQSSRVFVSLTLAAWSLIIFGYLVPFMVVATLLTLNGYTPTVETERRPAVFPTVYSSTGAPPNTINQLRTVLLEEFPSDYPKDCCICMNDFASGDVIVATECSHVFHKRCFQEWLRQARTCPVCRSDIPHSLSGNGGGASAEDVENQESASQAHPPHLIPGRQDFQHEVVNLLRFLRENDTRHSHGVDEQLGTIRRENDDPNHAPVSL